MSFLLNNSVSKKKGGRSRGGGGGGGLPLRRPGLPSSLLGGGHRNHQVRGRSNSLASHGSVGGYPNGHTGGGSGGDGSMLPPNAVDVGGGQFQIQRQRQQQHRVIPQMQQQQQQMQRPVQQHMVAAQNPQQLSQVQQQQQAQQKEQAVEQQQDQIGDFSMESGECNIGWLRLPTGFRSLVCLVSLRFASRIITLAL